MVASVSQTHQCEFIVNVYLSGHRNDVKVVYLRRESYCARGRTNNGENQPKRMEICERERKKKVTRVSHRKSAEKFICFMPIYGVIRVSFLRCPLRTVLNLACQQLRANISTTKDHADSSAVRQQRSIRLRNITNRHRIPEKNIINSRIMYFKSTLAFDLLHNVSIFIVITPFIFNVS